MGRNTLFLKMEKSNLFNPSWQMKYGWTKAGTAAWIRNCMHKWMNPWMHECINELMDEWMDEWMNWWRDEWMNEWMNGWIDEEMNGWMDKRINGWLDENVSWKKFTIPAFIIGCAPPFRLSWISIITCFNYIRKISMLYTFTKLKFEIIPCFNEILKLSMLYTFTKLKLEINQSYTLSLSYKRRLAASGTRTHSHKAVSPQRRGLRRDWEGAQQLLNQLATFAKSQEFHETISLKSFSWEKRFWLVVSWN